MESLMSRATLYDMLSMIVPGFITLLSLVVIYFKCFGLPEMFAQKGCCMGSKGLTVAMYICIFALSYLVGMMVNKISQYVFDEFIRNNLEHIKDARTKFMKDINERRNKKTHIDNGRNIEDEDILEDYYERYYLAAHYPFSAIPVLEAQVSFIRSMLLVILLSCIAIYCNDGIISLKPYCAITILLILDIIAFFHMLYLQKKIHFKVYEDSYYMKLIKGGWKGDGKSKNGSSGADDKVVKCETHSHEDGKKSMTKSKK